ncbi:hypothetical protein D2E25_1766 [Bifidobacterium goeldii]|uniref:DUF4190 domain-containing protein n=1 Tax=Bifidobacterium goeldii TaxID=2306975 RepID=A0A430FG83_9BIFI|nr:DUF4190 domain-containing protein [Bifidobacterium goeldii]RSX51791.1 hypothetical protein D2E25_1766 [Bifidobacterium goeldii]
MDADFNNPMGNSNDPRDGAGQSWGSPSSPNNSQDNPQQNNPYETSSPYGQNPYAQAPYEQTPYGQTPYSQTASDAQGAAYGAQQAPQYGQPYGQNPQYGQYGQPYSSQPYGGQPYAQYPPSGAYYPSPFYEPPAERWNTLAIIGFVLCFFFVPAALIISIIALRQINRTHERGKGFAIASIVISAICIAIIVVAIIIGVVAVIWAINNDPSGWSGSYCVGSDCSGGDYGDFEDVALRQIAAIRAMSPFAWLR